MLLEGIRRVSGCCEQRRPGGDVTDASEGEGSLAADISATKSRPLSSSAALTAPVDLPPPSRPRR